MGSPILMLVNSSCDLVIVIVVGIFREISLTILIRLSIYLLVLLVRSWLCYFHHFHILGWGFHVLMVRGICIEPRGMVH